MLISKIHKEEIKLSFPLILTTIYDYIKSNCSSNNCEIFFYFQRRRPL